LGAENAGEDFGIHVEWIAPSSEADVQRQIHIVNSFISRGVAGIALAPIDKKALAATLRTATGSRIPIAIFDSGVESQEYIQYVATDNAGAGRLAARRMGKVLNGSGEVAVVSFMPGSAATLEREQAFQDELRLLFPGIKVVALQYGMADRARAKAATEAILSTHPSVGGVFTDNESSSLGALDALRARRAGAFKHVAFDSTSELVQGLKSGEIDSLIVQNPYRMGYETVRGLAAKLAGKQPPLFIDSGVRLVLAADLDLNEVRQLLFPNLRPYAKLER
jgi:ribose transport system substrate-binding protein